MNRPQPALAQPTAPRIVLDTNVLLDWLVFEDPSTHALGRAIQSAKLQWWVTAEFRDELAHVLARGIKTMPELDSDRVWRYWDALSVLANPAMAEIGDSIRSASRYVCTDPDDQKFIDFAMGCGARWLLSRDKAVLKLARQVIPLGLCIITPIRWASEWPNDNARSN